MATAAAPRGSAAEMLVKKESSYGTPPSGNYTKVPFYSDTLAETQPWESDPLLGMTRNNENDATQPAPGLPGVSGQVVFPADVSWLTWYLAFVMGDPSTAGSGNLTHTYNSGASVLAHWTLEKKLGASLYSQLTGMIGKKITFDIARAAGYEKVTVDFLGRKEAKITSTGGGTPASMLTRQPLVRTLPVFKIGGVAVADVISMRAEYDNGVVAQDYIGDTAGYPLGHDTDDESTFTGTLKMRLRAATVWDTSKALAAIDSSLLWQISATRSLNLAMAAMYLEPNGAGMKDKGRVEQDFNFRCAQTAAAPMLIATLKTNTVAPA